MMSFVRLENVSKVYRRGEHVVTPLDGVDLDVEDGEFFVLLGPSGSGKSTLLNLVAGIDRPDEGRVTVAGAAVHDLRGANASRWRAENIGYVFQEHNLVPVLTAYENVEVPLWLFPMSRDERHRRVSVALEAVDLSDRHDHLPKQLSGGQMQRVAIARAIVADPSLLVADEPTGNLDERAAAEVLDLFERLNRDHGKTIIMVTHDPRALERGTRVLRLDKGRLAALESTS